MSTKRDRRRARHKINVAEGNVTTEKDIAVDYKSLKVAELKDILDERNIEYASDLRKDDLIELIEK